MIKFIRRWLHIHRFKTTHTNKWMIPTREVCRCGLVRQKAVSPINSKGPWLEWWEYSDGSEGVKESVFKCFE